MKLSLVFSAAGLVATSWVASTTLDDFPGNGPVASTETTRSLMAQPVAVPVTPAGTMRANKAAYTRGDVLELSFSTPHAEYLAIRTPGGKFFYVVFPTDPAMGKLTPLVDSRAFGAMSSLRINTGTLTADPYTYGVVENKPVFTQSGTYTFILGNNLHVDDARELTTLKVKYRHERAETKRKITPKKTKTKKHTNQADVAAL